MKTYDKYTYFWSGPFSQWYDSEFVIDEQKYSCAEQYMMYKKALTFGDVEIANAVMRTLNPKEQKALGRQVRGFNIEIWAVVARDIVFRGNVAKFIQNDDLNDELMKTTGTMLVEASPLDKVWGIGLDAKAAKLVTPAEWKGTNWLGQCITEVREALLDAHGLN